MLKSVTVVAVVACVLQCVTGRTVVTAENNVDAEKELAPKVQVGGGGVSASFGGYSASAGLGGQVGGSPGAVGGLYAHAGTPDGTGASAGLGGAHNSGANVGGNVGSGNGSPPNTKNRPSNPNLYNDIFNIPTSILGAVNRLLNGASAGAIRLGTSGASAHVGTSVGEKSPDVGTRVNVGAYAETGGQGSATGGTKHRPTGGLFDDIFNIPITALTAVNQLLNNKNGK